MDELDPSLLTIKNSVAALIEGLSDICVREISVPYVEFPLTILFHRIKAKKWYLIEVSREETNLSNIIFGFYRVEVDGFSEIKKKQEMKEVKFWGCTRYDNEVDVVKSIIDTIKART